MSIELMAMVFKAQGLKSTHKLVLLALADHGNDEGDHIYPSVPLLASKTALSERAVQTTLAELRDENNLKLLTVVKQGGGKKATEYKMNVEKLRCMTIEGCSTFTPGVQHVHPRGAGDAPLTIIEPLIKPEVKGAVAPPMTAGQDFFLSSFNAKRFANNIQRQAVLDLENKYGLELLKSGVKWAATNGMGMGKAITALQTAIPKWDKPKPSRNGNGNGHGPEPAGFAGLRAFMEKHNAELD